VREEAEYDQPYAGSEGDEMEAKGGRTGRGDALRSLTLELEFEEAGRLVMSFEGVAGGRACVCVAEVGGGLGQRRTVQRGWVQGQSQSGLEEGAVDLEED